VGSIPTLGSRNYRKGKMRRLVLKQKDKKLTGLCAGIADYLEVDVTVIRLIVLSVDIMTGVLPGLFVYLIASAITPKEGEHHA
jgi:phage shock protein C